jgi:hypothetical protein
VSGRSIAWKADFHDPPHNGAKKDSAGEVNEKIGYCRFDNSIWHQQVCCGRGRQAFSWQLSVFQI